jgi:hypothetical protein
MMSVDGALVGVPRDVRARLNSAISLRTGARLETRGGSGAEYRVIGRRRLGTLVLGVVFRPELAGAGTVTFLGDDARDLPSVSAASVDAIVTDPPWGEHDRLGEPYPLFASAVAHAIRRVLRPGTGRFVILIGRRRVADLRAALLAHDLVPRREHEILVNGHPATVLTGRRTPETRDQPLMPVIMTPRTM